jgi:N-methylhydantoinase B
MSAQAQKVMPPRAESEQRFVPRSDLITFEVLRHRLWQINDEQGRSIINVSGSPVASETNDFNVALADADGNLICIGPYVLFHLSAISIMIRKVKELLGDRFIEEGDVYLCNDPWMGAVHQNDVCLIAPVHRDGKLVAWVGSTIHQVDVGGPAPGSWNYLATDTFQEAPRYRFLKLMRKNEIQPEVLETYLTNSRVPDLVELDLRGQIAAANVAKERLDVLLKKYGTDTVASVMADMLDYTEFLFRRKLAAIPDGEWYAEDYLDHNGHREFIHTLRLKLTKRGTEVTFDFRGTDPQAEGFINATYAGMIGGVFTAVVTFLCNDIPWNDAVFNAVKIISDIGTVNNCAFPAPCSMATISATLHTCNVTCAVLGRMLSCSDTLRHNVMAGWLGSGFVFNIFGRNQYGEPFGTMMVNSHMGGGGARYTADGYDNSGSINVPRASITNVESAEGSYPLLYLFRRRAIDSAGAGTYRGGVSGENAITPYGVDQINLVASTLSSNHSSSAGLAGGYPGGGSQVLLKRGTGSVEAMTRDRLVPRSWEEVPGEEIVLPPKQAIVLRAGDVFNGVPPGGGGFLDPLERAPESVERDIRDGYFTAQRAYDVFGVVIDPKTSNLDLKASEQERLSRRTGRVQSAGRYNSPKPVKPDWAGDDPRPRFGETLRVDRDGFVCARCDEPIAASDSNPKESLPTITQELSAAGPWVARRWDGFSPDFHLIEYFCPGCGYCIDRTQRRKNEHKPWNDYQLSELSSKQ